jgi:cell division protein FtsI (penicillin-binding protein 3)
MTALAAKAPLTDTSGQRQQSLALTYHRLMLVMLVFAGVTALIVGRLVYLQIFTDRSVVAIGNPLLPARGDLVDRNGVPLARTIDAWSIAVHPKKLLGNPDELAARLAALMPERSAAEYRAILTSNKNFVYLSRRAVPELVSAVNALGEPAIAFDREPERLYPQTALAAHILGWTDFDGRGVTGMEKVLEDRLSNPDTRGTPTALSIDSRVQAAVEAELGAAMTKHQAEGGTGIVLDVRTGEIIALASFRRSTQCGWQIRAGFPVQPGDDGRVRARLHLQAADRRGRDRTPARSPPSPRCTMPARRSPSAGSRSPTTRARTGL